MNLPNRAVWIPVVVGAVTVIATLSIATRLPSHYEADATVRMDFAEISPELVRWSPAQLANMKRDEIRDRIIDRANLSEIVNRYDLAESPQEPEELTEQLAQAIRLEVLSAEVGAEGDAASIVVFSVSYQHESPAFARRVADAIADAVVMGAGIPGQTTATAPETALDGPVAALSERTNEAARRFAQAEGEYGAGSRKVDQLQDQQDQLTDQLRSLPALGLHIAATTPSQANGETNGHRQDSTAAPSSPVPGTVLERRADTLETKLREVRSELGASHAGAWRIASELAIVRERIGNERASGRVVRVTTHGTTAKPEEQPTPPQPSTMEAGLQARLAGVGATLKASLARQAFLEQKVVDARSALTAARQLERDARAAPPKPQTDSRTKPRAGKAREANGVRFVLAETSSISELPVGPQHLNLLGVGAIASLVFGIGAIPLSRSRKTTLAVPDEARQTESNEAVAQTPVPAGAHLDELGENFSRPESATETAPASSFTANEATPNAPVPQPAPTVNTSPAAPPPTARQLTENVYEANFGLRGKPFSLLPDPSFLYMSKQHTLSFSVLQYGLANNAGLTVLTGEIGCGKTTLLRHLLNEVDDDLSVGLLTNTHPSFRELLQWISAAFGLEYERRGKVALHQAFVDYMIEQYRAGRRTVLIIDEAQNMSAATLEELRMLSNVNVDDHLLLQLVLVGQPQLRNTLARPDLVQVAQRIGADYALGGFEPEETKEYISHRLRRVGGDPGLFEAGTHEIIHRGSKGVPRIINVLCDTALVYAYGSNQQHVSVEIATEVVRDRDRLRGTVQTAEPAATPAWGRPKRRSQSMVQENDYASSPLLDAFSREVDVEADAKELFSNLRDKDVVA